MKNMTAKWGHNNNTDAHLASMDNVEIIKNYKKDPRPLIGNLFNQKNAAL